MTQYTQVAVKGYGRLNIAGQLEYYMAKIRILFPSTPT